VVDRERDIAECTYRVKEADRRCVNASMLLQAFRGERLQLKRDAEIAYGRRLCQLPMERQAIERFPSRSS
jgi:hypothetical protein